MLLKHLWHKIYNYKEFYIYNLSLIILGIIVVFLMISFREISVSKINKAIIFGNQSVLITSNIENEYYINGFKLDSNDVNVLKQNYDYLTLSKSTDISSAIRQNISFSAVTPDFLETGVVTFDYRFSKLIAQKVDLLFGQVWEENSTDPVVIIDETSAFHIFGYYNVVGNVLETSIGNLSIVGVVSDTITRSQLIQNNIDAGQVIDEYIFSTYAYIPYKYFEIIQGNETIFPDNYIISDNDLINNELKENIINDLNILDPNILVTRYDMIQSEIMDHETYFKIIASIISVFIVLGIINMINISTFFFSIFKRNNAIYRVVGATKWNIICLNLLEGFITSSISSFGSILMGFSIVLTSSIFMHYLEYINILILMKHSFVIVTTVIILTTVINFTISLIYTKKSFYNELKDIEL